MGKETTLESTRQEAGIEILALKENIFSTRILNFFGRAFKKRSLGYWLANIILLNLIALSPWILIGMLLQKERSLDYLFLGLLATEAAISGLIVGDLVIQNLFDDIGSLLIEKIDDANDIFKLLQWLKKTWSIQYATPFVVGFCIWWVLLGVGSWSIALGEFVGYGFSLTTVIVGLLAGVGIYVPVWVILLASNLKNYRYDVNILSPADSEIVHNISEMLIKRVYIIAVYFTVFTLLGSSNLVTTQIRNIFSLPIFVLAWTLISAQFLITRSTIKKIVNEAKWKTLNKLQKRINSIEASGDLSDRETAERLLRLADIHNRVLASQTNTFNWKSLSTFISQLMLPLLGLLLGNIDKLPDFLK